MGKLHELLAVEGKLQGQAKKVINDLTKTFTGKRHLFEEKRIVFKPDQEDADQVVEAQSDLNTTVPQELKFLCKHLSKSLDASYRVAETNTTARADIKLEDGTVVAENVPATALLELEKRVGEVSDLIKAIPTLDPAKGFSRDADKGVGVYQARPVTKTRTRKTQKPVVLYEATEEHPAQVQLVSEDVRVGQIFEQEWSGLITPAQKSEYLDRAEVLVRAIRQARSRANEETVDSGTIADNLLEQIFG